MDRNKDRLGSNMNTQTVLQFPDRASCLQKRAERRSLSAHFFCRPSPYCKKRKKSKPKHPRVATDAGSRALETAGRERYCCSNPLRLGGQSTNLPINQLINTRDTESTNLIYPRVSTQLNSCSSTKQTINCLLCLFIHTHLY